MHEGNTRVPRPISLALTCMFTCLASTAVLAQADINRIVDEGLNHSQATRIAQQLDDVIGARLTGSPQMSQAQSWALQQFSSWGLANVHKEAFDFGRGWYAVSWSVNMVSPRKLPLTAVPIAWSPSTNGVLSAPVMVARMESTADFDRWRGKLRGKIVLADPAGPVRQITTALFERTSADDAARREVFHPPDYSPESARAVADKIIFTRQLDVFLRSEGAVARVQKSNSDYKLLHGTGYNYRTSDLPGVPAVEMAAEDYRRLVRLATLGEPPVLAIDSDVRFDDSDHNAYNLFAEIPGTVRSAGYILVGAHLDSWAAGDGAMDDGAGVTTVMESARILATLHIHPRRTIRFVLWSGEEQGLVGSRAYTDKYLATNALSTREDLTGIEKMLLMDYAFPVKLRPGYAELKAYFNVDCAGGRIRGLTTQGNIAAIPLAREWLAPFTNFGATFVSPNKGAGDHAPMNAVGAPALAFSADLLDGLMIYHSNADTLDHLLADDLRQAAAVVSGVVLNAANDRATLPPMPIPSEGVETTAVIP